MPQRLTASEAALLAAESRRTPQHVSSVDIFTGDDIDVDAIAALIEERLAYVPRYRLRVREVPGGLAAPVWVEDADFDPAFHIRHSALPRPGTARQLDEFVARVTARQLDLDRPLWECYIVEGLQPDPDTGQQRCALITKTHPCLVDGIDAVELCQVLLDDIVDDDDADDDETDDSSWGSEDEPFEPLPEPRMVDLVFDAVREGLSGPGPALAVGRRSLSSAVTTALAAGEAFVAGGSMGGWAGTALRGNRGPLGTPFGGVPSEQRRFARTVLQLDDLRALRGASYTINDVILTVIAGGLRAWLAAQDVRARELLALVPMSVVDTDGEPSALGSHVSPHLISLPLFEPNPLMRMRQISHGTRAHTDTGRAVSAHSIRDIAGFAPMTLHTLAVRASHELVLRPHHLLVTNAPGPQHGIALDGVTMTASHPVLPVEPGRLLSIGVTSYDGKMFVGVNADRDQVRDPELLVSCIDEAVGELQAAWEDG
ncbi:wax ester/triacylglycerol synthase family O-acyltransferase [Propioniferax innocua]|uniref:Diacylglycerol O-acyltransferase n=1 Tax=Propioniferax innocua TaxID=1753 RepID=A0A542ZBE8_9ACTN|nr:wax ester/triacylglycerol synthase family O-acyltransferase [Propioniferax innocua]TQL57658.1 WS/DGAT/MGAT family acyltransferase [Propioniferax innocua]